MELVWTYVRSDDSIAKHRVGKYRHIFQNIEKNQIFFDIHGAFAHTLLK